MKTVALLLLFTSAIFPQNSGIAIYKKTFTPPDKSKLDGVNLELQNSMNIIGNLAENYEFELLFNLKNSKYSQVKKLVSDENSLNEKMARVILGELNTYYCDIDKKELLKVVDNFGEILLVTNKNSEWVLTNETKNINGHLLRKATSIITYYAKDGLKEKEVVAWYNPNINVPFGPVGYFGLPGLIVEIEDGLTITYLETLKFTEKEQEIIFPDKGKLMSEEEYFEYTKKQYNRYKN